jgi:hypothetical protein
VDPRTRTMAMLYGNDAAMLAIEARTAGGTYPAGSVLALVTWAQRDDPHWFGARIPDRPLSVEFVLAGSEQPVYQRFAGPGLGTDPGGADAAAERTKFVLGLAPAPLP